jgi:hypothetical protein
MAASVPMVSNAHAAITGDSLHDKLNSKWHKPALYIFMAIVIGHWAEHIVQAYQIWVMGWSRPAALGLLGLCYPWLIKTEILHYGYALVMLIGIWYLRKGFTGTSRKWWDIALYIQFWHHIEHLLLLYQATVHHNFWHRAVPTSVLQFFFPRVELHLFYNTIVFIPMVVGMYYHLYPPVGEQPAACTCALHRQPRLADAPAL